MVNFNKQNFQIEQAKIDFNEKKKNIEDNSWKDRHRPILSPYYHPVTPKESFLCYWTQKKQE